MEPIRRPHVIWSSRANPTSRQCEMSRAAAFSSCGFLPLSLRISYGTRSRLPDGRAAGYLTCHRGSQIFTSVPRPGAELIWISPRWSLIT